MSIAYVSLHTSHQTRTRHIRVQFTTGIRSHLASFAQWNPSFNMGEVLALDWSRPYRALRYSLTTLTRVSRNRNLSMLGQHFYLFGDFEYEWSGYTQEFFVAISTSARILWWILDKKRGNSKMTRPSSKSLKVAKVNLRTLELLSVFARKRYLETNELAYIWHLGIKNRHLLISFRLCKMLTRDSLPSLWQAEAPPEIGRCLSWLSSNLCLCTTTCNELTDATTYEPFSSFRIDKHAFLACFVPSVHLKICCVMLKIGSITMERIAG